MSPKKSKQRRTFKDRVRNFFLVEIETNVQEEECTKTFENVTWLTLSKNKIFYSILAFMLLIDILVVFNLNTFYIRAILAFLFIALVPGLLIMLMLKIREVGFWEYLVYVIGLSVSFIMFAGLAVNWILPWLNITNKPLATFPILICFNIFLIAFWIIAWIRNKDFKPFEITMPKLNWINRIFFVVPMFFPVLAILGAFLLNNHGTNILTMIMLGGIAVYVFMVVLLRKKLNPNVYPWAILMISIALLMSGWMRSWFVSGADISLEYWVFQLTNKNAFWGLSIFNNAYNAMLSLNIFPTILSDFIHINDQFIFKLFIPIIFSIVPLIIYLISRRILSHLFCFFAGLLFLFLPDFVNWYCIPVRQEIAFIFFSLMILILFTKQLNLASKKILFVIFGASMIISHYSTSYIALALFILTYIFISIYKIHENQKIKKGKLHPSQKLKFYLTGTLILLLLLFGFLWYSQVTRTSDGLIDFADKSISNLGNMFKEDNRQGGATDPIFGFFNKQQKRNFIEEYRNQSLKYDLSNKLEGFPKEKYSNYEIKYLQSKTLDPKNNLVNFFAINYYLKQVISKIFQLFIIFGLLYIIINKRIGKDLKIVFMGASMIIFLFLLLPFFSIDYGITRFVQQTLIILAPLSILGGKVFFKRLKVNSSIVLSILLILFFLLFSGFGSQLMGGDVAKMQLNNFGKDYDTNYIFYQDFFGASWLDNNQRGFNVYSDISGSKKINSYAGKLNMDNTNLNLVPNTISKPSYVYLSTINNVKKMGFFVIRSLEINFNFPTEFLNENKNKIYNNGGSEIFK